MAESKGSFNPKKCAQYVGDEWDKTILQALVAYIGVPNLSPQFDKTFYENDLTERALGIMVEWVNGLKMQGMTMEVLRAKDRTPLIFIQIEGEGATKETVLCYSHLDKQPPFLPWADGLHPYKAVLREGKLYGRGGADDGYGIFAALTAVNALKKQGCPHPRVVVMVESCEESGSRDLMHYVELKKKEIGIPSLVVCLDSGCGNYEQMWLTTSLRGMLLGELRVKILTEGVHSGSASGIVPSSFRILRNLMDRVEDSKTGEVLVKEAHCQIPDKHVKYAAETAATLGKSVIHFPFVRGAYPISDDLKQLLLNVTWKPAWAITGVDGIPPLEVAGNVLRPETAIKLSLRLPPLVQPEPVEKALIEVLTKNVPYGARATYTVEKGNPGWSAPLLHPWLESALSKASFTFYQKPVRLMGEGGSIPFMGMLGKTYPETQFVITGVLGPGSNAHGPNEFLHIQMAKNLTCSVASILADHYTARVLKQDVVFRAPTSD